MNTRKTALLTATCLVLAACSDTASVGGGDTPQQRAAAACEAEAKTRLGEKTYQIDSTALTQSAKRVDDQWDLRGPITVNPGLRDEAKQTLECRVRALNGKAAEVTYINFIF
jgi:hypothetical protein